MKWKIIGAAAALAIAMPLATATPSAAQGHRGGGGAHMGGGHGGHFGAGARGFGGAGRVGGMRSHGIRPMASGGWHGGRHVGGWHGGGRYYRRGGVFPGFAAGAIIGGALAAPYAYGYGYPYSYYDDDYYVDAPAVTVAPAGGDSVAYCQQRFKSYDVRSGTYLGYDGLRHPCP